MSMDILIRQEWSRVFSQYDESCRIYSVEPGVVSCNVCPNDNLVIFQRSSGDSKMISSLLGIYNVCIYISNFSLVSTFPICSASLAPAKTEETGLQSQVLCTLPTNCFAPTMAPKKIAQRNITKSLGSLHVVSPSDFPAPQIT